ncbi:TrmB family transcriptional regulator [Candidatus Woesearchaeota archaeon]|nr:TrmB family transcriptional regulator [Candidatus Woesearchaeota archaeon]
MMQQELMDVGLTEYESKVYETLVVEGDLTGGKISRLSGVPQGKVYTVLNSLIEKGFVSVTPIKPKIFRAKDSSNAISSFLNQKIKELTLLKEEIPRKLRNVNISQQKELSEQIHVLGSKQSTYSTIAELTMCAKKEIKHVFTFETKVESLIYLDLLKAAIKNGVQVKIIAAKSDNESRKMIKRYAKEGIQVKHLPLEEIRFFIKDSDECLINFLDPNDKRKRLALYFSHSGFSKHMSHYFDELWRRAT